MRPSRRPTLVALAVLVSLALADLPAVGATEEAEAPAEDSESAEEQALVAAETWLALVDEGDFAESWESAAALFKNAVTPEQWEQSLNAVRTPLGAVTGRTVKMTQFTTSLPGAPDGEYVVIQLEASFENKASAVETITPMRDPDGVWRVSGYYIK